MRKSVEITEPSSKSPKYPTVTPAAAGAWAKFDVALLRKVGTALHYMYLEVRNGEPIAKITMEAINLRLNTGLRPSIVAYLEQTRYLQ